MINLSIRDYRLTIAALDCTQGLISFQGSDNKLDESGLISFKGSLVLAHTFSTTESLDDRVNSRWDMGGAVNLTIANAAGILLPPPRVGQLFILDSAYDIAARKLTLQTGDLLALLKVKQPAGDASKICLGNSVSRTAIVNALLTAAGAPALKAGDTIPGFLNAPAPRLIDGSYIDQAGKIAAAAGYLLYVDEAGQIRAKPLNPNAIPAAIAITTPQLAGPPERVTGQQPPNKLKVQGKAAAVRQTKDSNSETILEYGPAGVVGAPPLNRPGDDAGGTGLIEGTAPQPPNGQIVIKRSEITEEFDRGGKVKTITTLIYQPIGLLFPEDPRYQGSTDPVLAESQQEKCYYEANSPIAGNSTSTHCQQGNQGRLIQKVLSTGQLRGIALREVCATFPKSEPPDRTSFLKQAEVTVIDYEYNLSGNVSATIGAADDDTWIPESLGSGPRITTKTYKCVGAVCPKEYRYKSPFYVQAGGGDVGDIEGNAGQLSNPEQIVQTEQIVQEWREINFGDWRYVTTTYQSLANASGFSLVVEKLRKDLKKTYGTLVERLTTLMLVKNDTKRSGSGQAQPPAPETYSPAFSSSETTVTGKYLMPTPSPYQQPEQSMSFDYISAVGPSMAAARAVAQAECNALAVTWGKILWGRYKCTSYKTAVDHWWGYTPCDRVDVTEHDTQFAYLGDGYSFAMAGKRCVVGFDGLFLGRVQVALQPNPAVLVDPQAPATIAVSSINPPYLRAIGIELASGSGLRVERKISPPPVRISVQLASGSAIEVTRSLTIKPLISRTVQLNGGAAVRVIRQPYILRSVKIAAGAAVQVTRETNLLTTEDGFALQAEDGSALFI